LNKKQWMIPLSALMVIGASGCTNDDERAGGNGSNNSPQPVGYYSNENHPAGDNQLFRDDDGAVPEIMDHTFGDEDRANNEQRIATLQTKDENGNPKNPTQPLAKTDRNFFQRDNRFSTSDANYHGHLSKNIGNAGVVTNRNDQEKITDQIRNRVRRVDNVRSIRSVTYGNVVRISVKLLDADKADETKQAIINAVQPIVDDRDIKVVIDEGSLGRDRNINNQQPQPEPNSER